MLQYEEQLEQLAVENSRLTEQLERKQSEKGELLEFKNRLLEERSQKIEELARLNEAYTQSRLLRLIIRIFRIGRKKNRNTAGEEDAE